MNVCPTCRGAKVLKGFGCPGFKPITLPCYDCDGTGEVSDERAIWRRDGEGLRKFRQVRDLSLHEAAAWLGCPAREWSDAEHGKVDPSDLSGRVQRKAIADVIEGTRR